MPGKVTQMSKMCEGFARAVAKEVGISYSKAREVYPRGLAPKTVYLNGYEESPVDHCVHCARANALLKYGVKGKSQEVEE